jgi:hypothetical protein
MTMTSLADARAARDKQLKHNPTCERLAAIAELVHEAKGIIRDYRRDYPPAKTDNATGKNVISLDRARRARA